MDELPREDLLLALAIRRTKMTKETWIKNVLKAFPEKSREEVEKLYEKIFKN